MKYLPFLFLFWLIACNDSNTTEPKPQSNNNGHTLHASAQKIEISYPKNWIHTFNPDSTIPGALITILTPLENEQDGYQENVKMYHEVLPMRISDSLYHASAMAQIRINNHDVRVKNLGHSKIGNNDFNEWYFEFSKENKPYCVHGYTCMHDSVGYNFSYTSSKDKENTYLPDVDSILSSFKPL